VKNPHEAAIMEMITGRVQNGRVELNGPMPKGWADGCTISLSLVNPVNLTGDTPEAISAWIAHYDELHSQIVESTFPEELSQTLLEAKAEELALWDSDNQRLESNFP